MLDENFDERSCVRSIAQGDQRAARELLRHFYPFVLKLVRAHLPRRVSEEDLVQIIFIKTFRNLGQYSGKMPLEHWISRVAINTCLNELKAERVRPEWRLADFSEEIAASIEQLARVEADSGIASLDDVQAAKRLVAQLLSHLPPEDRLLITMLHIEERSVAEIHQLTGWSRAAVKVRAFRARARMRKLAIRFQTLHPHGPA